MRDIIVWVALGASVLTVLVLIPPAALALLLRGLADARSGQPNVRAGAGGRVGRAAAAPPSSGPQRGGLPLG
jgi:hypothetical protein